MRILAVKSSAFSCVIKFLRPGHCNAIIFSKCATVISNAGSTRRSPTIGSPSICETATATNLQQLDMLPGRRSVRSSECRKAQKRTCTAHQAMSALGQKRTSVAHKRHLNRLSFRQGLYVRFFFLSKFDGSGHRRAERLVHREQSLALGSVICFLVRRW